MPGRLLFRYLFLLSSLFFLFQSAIGQGIPPNIPQNGLIAYYPFSGNANDVSLNQNHGTVVGNVILTTDRFNLPNSAYSFPASPGAYINVPSSASLQIRNAISMSAWILAQDGYINPRILSIMGAANGTCETFYMATHGTSNSMRALDAAFVNDDCMTGMRMTIPGIPAMSWQHLVFIVDPGGEARFYLNGTLVGTKTGNIVSTPAYTSSMNIGRHPSPAFDAWGGKIDEVILWNRALTPQEVSQLYAPTTTALPNVNITGISASLASCSGLPSAPKPLQVSGSNLRGDITVTAPAGYEISLDPNTGYAASLVLSRSGTGVPNTTVYLRLRPDAVDGAGGLVTATTDMTPVSSSVAGGLVAHFNFAGNANDASSNANHGTTSNTTYVVDRFCQPGNAIQMNQGASLVCTQKSYTAPAALSYSVWVKSTSTVGGHLIGFNNGRCTHQGQWDRVLGVQPGSVYFYTYPGAELRTFVPANVLDGAWHHLAVTFDAQGTRIYVDGTLAKHEPAQNRGENFTGYFRVGGLSPNNLNNTLPGDYDDVRIYDRVLSADDVKYLSATHAVGTCPASVTARPTISSAGPDRSNCNNGSFTPSGNTPNIGTGQWTVISGTALISDPSSANSVVTGVPAGTSAVLRWTISNGSCPASTDDVQLTNQTLPTTASAGVDQTNCNNGSFTLSGNTPTIGTGQWTVISGTALISDPSSATSVVTGIPAGAGAVLRWTISSGNCPASTDDVVLTSMSLPRIDFSLDSNNRCLGDMLDLKLLPESGHPMIDSISWNMGDGNVYRTLNIKHVYRVPGTYEINLRVSFRGGCKPDTVTKPITIHPIPVVDAGPDRLLPVGGRITLNATVSGGSGLNYQWTPANGLNDATRLRPEASPQQDTRYLLRATSAYGCADTSSMFVSLLLGIRVPNTFTPNDDGFNDRWEILHLDEFPGVVVEIYDTMGQIVFRSVGYPKPWDGTRNGMKMPAGAYYYVIDPKNGWKKMAGYVMLIR